MYFSKMSVKYKVRDNSKPYFITTSIIGWVDVFTRKNQKENIVDALKYCQEHKGLIIYSWCLMTNHLHMICQSAFEEKSLSDIMRDFKRYTSKKISSTILEEPESRRAWMLNYFSRNRPKAKAKSEFKVWQDGYHPIVIYSQSVLEEKLDYIHNNPVRASIVEQAEHYLYSSARNYADLDGLLKVELLSRRPKFLS
ncbi:MAG: transposase [Vicingaceae bacterium]